MLRNACDGTVVDGQGNGPCDGDPCAACVGETNGVSNAADAAACAAQNGNAQEQCEGVMGSVSGQPACTWSPPSRSTCEAAGDQCIYTPAADAVADDLSTPDVDESADAVVESCASDARPREETRFLGGPPVEESCTEAAAVPYVRPESARCYSKRTFIADSSWGEKTWDEARQFCQDLSLIHI